MAPAPGAHICHRFLLSGLGFFTVLLLHSAAASRTLEKSTGLRAWDRHSESSTKSGVSLCECAIITMATTPRGNPAELMLGPSDRLIAMFSKCCSDPTEAIKARLKRMLDTFLLHHRDDVDNEGTKELAEKCCREAEVWYYRILENVVIQKKEWQGTRDISGMVQNDLAQCCLVACCLEIMIFSNSFPCDLPELLQILQVESYHFWRVIEHVLRAAAGQPRAVFRHLSLVMERVLESLAWTSNSPLWEEIRANEGHLPTCQQVMPPALLEDPNSTDLQTDTKLPEAAGPQRSSPLDLFACKVYILMSRRLRKLCSTLDLCDELRGKIWTCFEYSLVHCASLVVDRHLDQLLTCATYITAKVTNMDLLFKDIEKCFNVCKNVLISDNGEHSAGILTPDSPSTHYPGQSSNLIHFYNHVYWGQIKHFAEQFAPASGVDTPPLSPYPKKWTASPGRQQLSDRHSIFISLLNPGTSSPLPTRLCYVFNTSPSQCLREINNMIKTGRSPNMRRLDEDEEEEEDAPSAKRLRVDDGESAWQRRLRNLANDRVKRASENPSS